MLLCFAEFSPEDNLAGKVDFMLGSADHMKSYLLGAGFYSFFIRIVFKIKIMTFIKFPNFAGYSFFTFINWNCFTLIQFFLRAKIN